MELPEVTVVGAVTVVDTTQDGAGAVKLDKVVVVEELSLDPGTLLVELEVDEP